MILPACCAAATATVLKSCMCSFPILCILALYHRAHAASGMTDLQGRTSTMNPISRRRFLKVAAVAGGAFAIGDLVDQMVEFIRWTLPVYVFEMIKIGIINTLTIQY